MSDEPKGFLTRWSQRKVQVRQGVAPAPAEAASPAAAVATPAVAAELTPVELPLASLAVPAQAAPAGTENPPAADATPPTRPAPTRPTLDDVDALTPESDFSRFMARDVDPHVKNSAMKKLFADPHYNVMDRLDTYIDDYNTADPIPKAMFKQLVQARMLGLLDDELEDQVQPVPNAAASLPAAVHEPEDVEAEVGTESEAESESDAELPDAAKEGGQGEPQPAPVASPLAEVPEFVDNAAAPSPGPISGPTSPTSPTSPLTPLRAG